MGEKDLLTFCVFMCYGWANTKKMSDFFCDVPTEFVCLASVLIEYLQFLNEEICEMLRIYK